jgi:hypothetical protein
VKTRKKTTDYLVHSLGAEGIFCCVATIFGIGLIFQSRLSLPVTDLYHCSLPKACVPPIVCGVVLKLLRYALCIEIRLIDA